MGLDSLTDDQLLALAATHNILPQEQSLTAMPTEQLQGLLAGPPPQALPFPTPAKLNQSTTRTLGNLAGPDPSSPIVSPQTTGERLYDIGTDPRGLLGTVGGVAGSAMSGGAMLPVLLAAMGSAGGQGVLEAQARGGQPAGRSGLDPAALGKGVPTFLATPPSLDEAKRVAVASAIGALTEAGGQALARYAHARLSPRAEKALDMAGGPISRREAFPPMVSPRDAELASLAQKLAERPPSAQPEYEAIMAAAGRDPVPLAGAKAMGATVRAKREPVAGNLELPNRLDKAEDVVTFAQAQSLQEDLGARAARVTTEGLPTSMSHEYGAAKDAVLDAMQQTLATRDLMTGERFTERFMAARAATRAYHERVLVAKIIGKNTDTTLALRGVDGAEIPVPSGRKLLHTVQANQQRLARNLSPDTLANLTQLAEAAAVKMPRGAPSFQVKVSHIIQGTLMSGAVYRAMQGSFPTTNEIAVLTGTIILPRIWARLVESQPFIRAAMVYAKNPTISGPATAALERLTLQAAESVLKDVHPEMQVLPRVPPLPPPPPLPMGVVHAPQARGSGAP